MTSTIRAAFSTYFSPKPAELTPEEKAQRAKNRADWERYAQASENPRILKYKPVRDLTMAELAVELDGFRGISTAFNSLRATQPSTDFLEHSKRLVTFTDCHDAITKTESGALDDSNVKRCEDVRSAMFAAIEKEREVRYPMLTPGAYEAEMRKIFGSEKN